MTTSGVEGSGEERRERYRHDEDGTADECAYNFFSHKIAIEGNPERLGLATAIENE